MADPVRLVTLPDRVATSSLDLLATFHALIEADEVLDIAIVGISREGGLVTGWSGSDAMRMTGAIYTLLKEITD